MKLLQLMWKRRHGLMLTGFMVFVFSMLGFSLLCVYTKASFTWSLFESMAICAFISTLSFWAVVIVSMAIYHPLSTSDQTIDAVL